MSVKFLSYRPDPTRPFNFKDNKKWQAVEGGSYKLLHPDMETDKQFSYAEVKAVKSLNQGERLQINGIANANIIDRMMERLDPRGIDVESYMKNSMLLAHHSYYHPIGQVDAIEIQDDGIHFSGWIGDPAKAELTPMQKEIRSLVAQGILKTVSVGFIPKKVRPPLFDDQGNMTEPCVIEAWELLELSVVAVPCNQDSVFEMRNIASDKKSAKIVNDKASEQSLNDSLVKDALEDAAQQNMVVQSLIFDKDMFTEDKAKQWALDHGFKADKVDATEDSYRLRQREPEEFDPDSFRTIAITEGVQAVVGKAKTNDGKAEDSKPEDYQQQVLALLQQVNEGQKRVCDMCELMLKKMEAKPSEDEGGEKPEEPVKPEGEDESAKAVSERVAKLEKGFDKLVASVSMLVEKLNK